MEKYEYFLFPTVYSQFSKTASVSIYIQCWTHPTSDLGDWSMVEDEANGEISFGFNLVNIEQN